MSGEVAPAVIQGRVVAGAVAQTVTRRDGMVRIVLTVMPGHPAATAPEGQTAEILFAEPVPVVAGERAGILIEWLPEGHDWAGPVRLPVATVLTRAHVRR
jgi:hypothetical protein